MKTFSFSLLLMVSLCSFQNSFSQEPRAAVTIKKELVKVYPTPNNEGSITIRSAYTGTLSFYLFNLEGRLIYQSSLKQAEEQIITGFAKGTYIYSVFNNDTNIDGGKININKSSNPISAEGLIKFKSWL